VLTDLTSCSWHWSHLCLLLPAAAPRCIALLLDHSAGVLVCLQGVLRVFLHPQKACDALLSLSCSTRYLAEMLATAAVHAPSEGLYMKILQYSRRQARHLTARQFHHRACRQVGNPPSRCQHDKTQVMSTALTTASASMPLGCMWTAAQLGTCAALSADAADLPHLAVAVPAGSGSPRPVPMYYVDPAAIPPRSAPPRDAAV
jgi:hypothetical protein